MHRRLALAFLAVASMALLSGCADPVGSMQMTEVSDAELAERASEATRGAGLYPAIDRQRTARRVIRSGELTVTAARPPLETTLPYRYRGRYYDLSREVVETEPGRVTLIHVDYNATDPGGSRLAFADLPGADRERLGHVLSNPPAIRDPGPEAELLLSYPADADSTLLDHAGSSVVVTYEGEDYVVAVERVREGEVRTFRYEATLLAGNASEYAADLKRTYGFRLSGLSEDERSVVETAISEGYYAEDTDDAGFASLVDRFRSREAIEADAYSGNWLVRYRGSYYWVEMNFGAFVERATPDSETPNVTPD